MEQYTYKFTHPTIVGLYWVYASSLVDAKKKFEEETGIDPESKDVTVARQEPGFTNKPENNPFV
ncbi:hypothetical protein PQB77_gp48 [Arthrobacter phage Correa]|uniref:Uncharacterized protein n=2 Tax=Mudcatvirus TaxID=1982088 RepID=A0A222ZKR6_9CAUD|nr:hypothetical protein PQB76_gp050 [Arthrobacter phage Cheesy]YP_010666336.1 hypothetical protein PQB77_gp48 [Arthrobacter phage Correa]ASR80109.1 hypothetical protein SEA_CORREA_48 [Arthrobacter phage Correa]ASR84630.1 hypothetical protein SEA_CHEESY_50 [Arthrobacter phage Cheesy]